MAEKEKKQKKVTLVSPKDTEELIGGSEVERNWRGVLIALLVILLVLSMIFLSTVLLSPPDRAPRRRGEKISVDDVISHRWFHRNATWVSENELIFRDTTEGLTVLNVELLTVRELMSNSTFRQLNAVDFKVSADLKYVMLLSSIRKVYTYTREAVYHVYEVGSMLRYAVGSPLEPAADTLAAVTPPHLQRVIWAPVGNSFAYVHNNDVYYSPSGKPGGVVQLTESGSDVIFNGIPDYIYQEEVFKSNEALWFSPTSEYLAFVRFNDTQVGKVFVSRYGDGIYPTLQQLSYPKAGTANPDVTVVVVDLNTTRSVEIHQPKRLGPTGYLTTILFASDSELMMIWVNRKQNFSLYTSCTAPAWNCSLVYIHMAQEGSVALWHNLIPGSPGTFFTILPILDADNGPYHQVCRISHGNMLPLTEGQMSVTKLLGWDRATKSILFEAAPPGNSSAQQHVFRTPDSNNLTFGTLCLTCPLPMINGSLEEANETLNETWPVRSQECLYVRGVFAPGFRFFLAECLGPQVPSLHILDSAGIRVLTLDSWSEERRRAAERSQPQVKIFQVEIANGYHAQVKLQLPPGFREYEDMTFPLLLKISFQPGERGVDYRYNLDYSTYLSSSRNFIIAEVDGRGSSASGLRHMNAAHLKIGTLDALDQITVTKYLRDLKFVDRGKMGVYGHGYGGYLAAMILSQDTDMFQCGLSISGIYSWPHYNSVWTERWLSNTTDNFRGYDESDMTKRAGNLKNKSLLFIHGMADLKAHYQQAMLLARSLTQQGVLFKHVTYPDEGHFLSGVREHLYRTMDTYWTDCFGSTDFTEWEMCNSYFSFKSCS